MIKESVGEGQCPAFQLYASDFLAGTQEMSQEEVGAYIRLLCHQWTRGSIPSDPSKQERLAGGPVSDDVLAKFPVSDGGERRNLRLESYRIKLATYRARKVNAGRSGADGRWGTKQNHGRTHGTAMPLPLADGWQTDGSSSSTSSSSSTLTPTPTPEGCGEVGKEQGPDNKPGQAKPSMWDFGDGREQDFAEFWAAYPRKVAKPQAMKAWKRISPDQELKKRIIDDVRKRSSSQDWTKDNGTFIPHPATYLNNQRWEDSAPAVAPKADPAALLAEYNAAKFRVESHVCHPTFGYKQQDLPQKMWDEYALLKAKANELKAKLHFQSIKPQ